MLKTKQRPGAKKGVPKPPKRILDDGFPQRLQRAIELSKLSITALAANAHCTRAVLHKYLSGQSKIIDVFVLFDISRALAVSPEWLLLGGPEMSPRQSLTQDQRLALNTLGLLTTEAARSAWISEGLKLHQQSQGLPPSRRK